MLRITACHESGTKNIYLQNKIFFNRKKRLNKKHLDIAIARNSETVHSNYFRPFCFDIFGKKIFSVFFLWFQKERFIFYSEEIFMRRDFE